MCYNGGAGDTLDVLLFSHHLATFSFGRFTFNGFSWAISNVNQLFCQCGSTYATKQFFLLSFDHVNTF